MAQSSSFGRELQSVGAATIKALSPNIFDQTACIESKILPEDLRLYLHKRRSILFYLHDTKVVYKMRLTWRVAC